MFNLPRLVFTFLLLLAFGWSHASEPWPLMPIPAKLEFRADQFHLNKDFQLAIEGEQHPRLYKAATRFLQRLGGRTGLFFKQGYISKADQSESAGLVIRVKRQAKVELHEDESYKLIILNRRIELTANTDLGAMHGLETLLQLLMHNADAYHFPGVHIEDAPRFPWRGLLMDVSRHYMPLDVIKRNLDAMAAFKMNVFHWHLTDDQGFRIECKTFPKLHEMGSDGFYYTHEQVREVIQYAADRGIRVMPEFDVPGHATSWVVGHPELASGPGPFVIERNAGVFLPTLNPIEENTYTFLEAFFAEMSALFTDSYIHIGGDENSGEQWDSNAEIQAFKKANNLADNHALQTHFNKRLLKMLEKNGKNMMGWDEILQPDLPKATVIHSWRGRDYLYNSAKQGYQTVLSNGYYIDLLLPAENHYAVDPIPADAPLTAAEKKNILGGEATMWAELVTPTTVDSRIWPRTAAIAERLWSQPASLSGNTRDLYARLQAHSLLLEELGLTHISNRERIMRGLVHSENIEPLKNLINLIEPLKGYTRNPGGTMYKSYSPFTLLADAATADAPDALSFRFLVEDYLADQQESTYNELIAVLQSWQQNHEDLTPYLQRTPELAEAKNLSESLNELSRLAIGAMRAGKSGTLPRNNLELMWQQAWEKAKKGGGRCELAVLPALKQLTEFSLTKARSK